MRVYGRKTITAYHKSAQVQVEIGTSETRKTSLRKPQRTPQDFKNTSYNILAMEIDNCGV